MRQNLAFPFALQRDSACQSQQACCTRLPPIAVAEERYELSRRPARDGRARSSRPRSMRESPDAVEHARTLVASNPWRRSACSIAANSFVEDIGLRRKLTNSGSKSPGGDLADIAIIGTCPNAGQPLKARAASMPLICGMCMSMTMRSGRSFPACSRPAWPLAAVVGRYPTAARSFVQAPADADVVAFRGRG